MLWRLIRATKINHEILILHDEIFLLGSSFIICLEDCQPLSFASEDLSSPRGTKTLEMPIFAKLGIRFIDHGMPLASSFHSRELLGPERRGICLDISVTRNDAPPAVRTSLWSLTSLLKISGNKYRMIYGNRGPVRSATTPPVS